MVCEHKNFMLASLQIVFLSLERFNNCQQLTIVGLISSLCWNHLSGKKGHQMLSAQSIRGQLTKNSTNSIAQNTRLNSDITL